MRRRSFIQGIVGSTVAWPLLLHPPLTVRKSSPDWVQTIGFTDELVRFRQKYVEAFRNGLLDNGLVEGRNITAIWYGNE